MGIHTKEWDDIPSSELMFCQTSPQEVLQMQPIIYKPQEVFSRNKHNAKIIDAVDTILDASEEAVIDENWWLLDN